MESDISRIVLLIGIFIITVCSVVSTLRGSNVERYSDNGDGIQNNNIPERQPLFSATRNNLLYMLFKEVCFNGSLDTNIHKVALQELQNKMMFYPTPGNYDMVCEKTVSDINTTVNKPFLCTEYDVRNYAIKENEYISDFENTDQFAGGDIANSSIIIDNNFYVIKMNKLAFGSEVNVEYVTLTQPSGAKNYIAVSADFSPWFILSRPLLIYVSMVGFFKVAYDILPNNNVMNIFHTNDPEDLIQQFGKPRLYLENVPAEIDKKPIVLQQALSTSTDDSIATLKLQFEQNKCKIFYIANDPRSDETFKVKAPLRFATIMNCSISLGPQQTFAVGLDQDRETNIAGASYITRITLNRSNTYFSITVEDTDIFKSANHTMFDSNPVMISKQHAEHSLHYILNNPLNRIDDFNVSFAFNTYMISILYIGEDEEKHIYVYRGLLEGIYQDRCFAIDPNLQFPQAVITYSLHSPLYSAYQWNFQSRSGNQLII